MPLSPGDLLLMRRMIREETATPRARMRETVWLPGTVGADAGVGASVSVRIDGDLVAVTMVNATGWPLLTGRRVYAQLVPPHGAFVVGFIGTTPPNLIADQVADGVAASWTFTIPQVYTDLEWIIDGTTAAAVALATLRFRFNGDTAGPYGAMIVYFAYGAAAAAYNENVATSMLVGYVPGVTGGAAYGATSCGTIPNYRGATLRKTCEWRSQTWGNAAGQTQMAHGGGVWNVAASAAPITSLTVIPSSVLAAGARIRVLGRA